MYTLTRSLAIYLLCGVICAAYLASSTVHGASGEIKKSTSTTGGKPSVITITEEDWDQLLIGEWMVEFHAPWCPACRALQPEWRTFSGWSSELGIKVGAVDVTANPGLSGRFLVTALPTIYHVKDGVFRQYKGTRESNTFVSFIEDKKWQSIEPITTWKSPDSLQMSFISHLFKISMALRSVHNSLVEDYGIPYWGSYLVFAFSTILVGAILGLVIVCVIDLIWPARLGAEVAYKKLDKSEQKAKSSGKSSSDEDEDDDEDIEDDTIEDLDDEDVEEDIVDESGDDKSSAAEELSPPASQSDEPASDEDQAAANQRGLRKRRARKD